jgi:hypothetical protein
MDGTENEFLSRFRCPHCGASIDRMEIWVRTWQRIEVGLSPEGTIVWSTDKPHGYVWPLAEGVGQFGCLECGNDFEAPELLEAISVIRGEANSVVADREWKSAIGLKDHGNGDWCLVVWPCNGVWSLLR